MSVIISEILQDICNIRSKPSSMEGGVKELDFSDLIEKGLLPQLAAEMLKVELAVEQAQRSPDLSLYAAECMHRPDQWGIARFARFISEALVSNYINDLVGDGPLFWERSKAQRVT